MLGLQKTNAYFDWSEILCVLFLSESLGPPSGYFQAECWLLAESSLHSWLSHGNTTVTCQIKTDAKDETYAVSRRLKRWPHSQEIFDNLTGCGSSRTCRTLYSQLSRLLVQY